VPCRYVIEKTRRLVITTGWDQVTFAEAKALQEQLESDPEFDSGFDQLIDGSAVTSLEMSQHEIRMIASRRLFSPSSRRAVVATKPAVFGIARMMQAFHDSGKQEAEISVFYERQSALKWLGLKDAEI
jgi:hypothetical protein